MSKGYSFNFIVDSLIFIIVMINLFYNNLLITFNVGLII